MQAGYNGYAPGFDGRPVRAAAKFYMRSKKVSEGTEPYKDVPFIVKYHAGSTDTTDRPVTEQDKRDYPELWAAFERGQDQDAVGWPIDQVPFLSPAQVENLKHFGIKTLEALANAPDTFGMLGIKDLKRKAQAMLRSAEDNKATLEMSNKIAVQDAQIEALRSQLAEMAKQMASQPVSGEPVQTPVAPRKGGAKPLQPAVLPESDD